MPLMRTTLDIEDDVLTAAKELAAVRRTTAGKVVSDLLRQAFAPSAARRVRNGVPLRPLRPANAPRPTLEHVNALRDEE
jgi:hypothetical protein